MLFFSQLFTRGLSVYIPKKPSELILIRHGESEGNVRLDALHEDARYQLFREVYKNYPLGEEFPLAIQHLARELINAYKIGKKPDHALELTQKGMEQSRQTGIGLKELVEPPHVIYVSPYARTLQTLKYIKKGWPELRSAKVKITDALREQQFGIVEQYLYHNLYFAFHPIHRAEFLADEYASYYYEFEGGESIARTRERVRVWFERAKEVYAEKRVFAILHNGTKLAVISELENLDFRQYMDIVRKGRFHNCGTTIYRTTSAWAIDDKMKCDKEKEYNLKLWDIA